MTDPGSNLSERELADLAALADGSLAPERRAAVEAWVASSPELRELLQRQMRAVSATSALADEPVPASLEAEIAARRGKSRARRRWTVPRLALAGTAAVVAAVLALVLIGGPAGPSVAEAAELAERPPSGPAPPPLGTEGTQLALDLEGVVFPDLLQRYGWQATGVRHDTIDGRDATTVFYEKDGERIAYVIVGGEGLPSPSGEPTYRNGVRIHMLPVDEGVAVTWRRLGRTCILVGPVSEEELITLASWRGDGTLRY